MVNLSSLTLTNTEEQVLCRGLNFSPLPRRIRYIDLVTVVEGIAHQLNTEEVNELRGSVCSVLKKAKLPSPKLRKEEQAALKTLKQEGNILIFTANKRNVAKVMDAEKYVQDMKNAG